MRASLRICSFAMLTVLAAAAILGTAHVYATQSPNGPGQPGAPGTTCGSSNASQTPGHSVSAPGSPFNPGGNAGSHYAGNPGTPSQSNSQSGHAISQYDIACFQNSQPHPHR